jgi:hypothetical protein
VREEREKSASELRDTGELRTHLSAHQHHHPVVHSNTYYTHTHTINNHNNNTQLSTNLANSRYYLSAHQHHHPVAQSHASHTHTHTSNYHNNSTISRHIASLRFNTCPRISIITLSHTPTQQQHRHHITSLCFTSLHHLSAHQHNNPVAHSHRLVDAMRGEQ